MGEHLVTLSEKQTEQPRNLALDGLRGVAVLLVLLYHHRYFNLGWMGVDLFFVLSGYLITSLLRGRRADSLYWYPFWVKRIARILPPLLLVIIATVALGFRSSWLQTVGYLLSLGDILAYVRSSFEPLRPLWSLAVEEHFYFVWPFAVRLLPRRALIYLLLALIVLEPMIRVAATATTRDWQFIYFLSPFRMDGLALGCLLSLVLEAPRGAALIKTWSGTGAVASVLSCAVCRIVLGIDFTRSHPTAFYNGACYSQVSFFCFFCVAFLISHPDSVVARWLTFRPLVRVGVLSYGIYLYQVVVRVTLTRGWHISDRQALWIDTPIILLLSWLSFFFYEKPILQWSRSLTENGRVPLRASVVEVKAVCAPTAL